MAKDEELKFNEAKRNFEEAVKEIEKAIEAYDTDWDIFNDVRHGINSEEFTRLKEVVESIRKEMPSRDIIIFPRTSTTTTNAQLPVQATKRNFFSNIREFFRRMLKRNQEIQAEGEIQEEEQTEINPSEQEENKEYNAQELVRKSFCRA